MAIYHFNAKTIGRSQGRSATGAAAYRAGVRIEDARTGVVFDYTRKRGVDGSEILTPDGSAPDRAALWNTVERSEKRVDAQLAREIEVALPRELTPEQMRFLVRGFVGECFVAAGMVADIAFHHLTGSNPHAHILLTLRDWQGGAFGLKRREWNERALCERWRSEWASHANAALEHAGHGARIDQRTLAEQAAEAEAAGLRQQAIALDRAPTIHERGNGAAAAHNAQVRQENADRLAAWAAIEAAVSREVQSMAAATDAHAPTRLGRRGDDDAQFRADMQQRRDLTGSRWRFFDQRVTAAAAWLERHADDEAKRLSERDRSAMQVLVERDARRDWLETHRRPPWWRFWERPGWVRGRSQIEQRVQQAKREAVRAERRASTEALARVRAAYVEQQTERAQTLRERRALALLPSEVVQIEREHQHREAGSRATRTTAALLARVEVTPSTRARPGRRR